MTNHENNNHGTEPTSERTTTTPEGHEHDDHPRPHIWIASLADYNNGRRVRFTPNRGGFLMPLLG